LLAPGRPLVASQAASLSVLRGPLDLMLPELGARSLFLTGVMTDSCVTMTSQ